MAHAVPAYLGGAAIVALALGYMTISPSELRAEVAGKRATVVAYRAGVEDPANEPYVRGGALVTSAFDWMQRERLGPWSPGGMVDGMRVANALERPARACLGEIGPAERVRGGRRLSGWIAAPDSDKTSRDLVVIDARGRRSGLGLVGLRRPDVEPGSEAEWAGFVAYVRNEPRSAPFAVVLLAENRGAGVCQLTETDSFP